MIATHLMLISLIGTVKFRMCLTVAMTQLNLETFRYDSYNSNYIHIYFNEAVIRANIYFVYFVPQLLNARKPHTNTK